MDGKDNKSVLSHEEDVAMTAPELARDHAALAPELAQEKAGLAPEVVQERASLAPELVEPAGRGQKTGAMNIIENPRVVSSMMVYPWSLLTMDCYLFEY
jgi:hypothetical protein